MNVSFSNNTMRSAALVVLSVLAATTLGAALVGASSTISTNISTGGTLTVTGASTLTGAVTMSAAATVGTTLGVTGASTLTGLVTMEAAATVGTTLGVTGHSTFASASSTRLSTSGNFASGTTTPWHIRAEAIIDGSGTTTLWITSSTDTAAGCIQMENALGAPVRLYVTGATALRVELGTCK